MTDTAIAEIARSLRVKIVDMLHAARSGHPGSSLSIVELLAVLFFDEMNLEGRYRDRLVLSKGHAVPALYAVFAELGWLKDDELGTLRQTGSRLQGHPDMTRLTLLDAGSGALGQGGSIAIGYALASQLRGSGERVYCIIGDGESQEGQIWEAAMYASARRLDNLVYILDHNKFQNEQSLDETLPMGPLGLKWRSFGWHTLEIDGHSIGQIREAFQKARSARGKPAIIIADTIKGKGVPFMENQAAWHSRTIGREDHERARAFLEVGAES